MDVAVPDPRVLEEEAQREKAYAAEKNSAGIRLAIVALNGAMYPFLDHSGHIVWLAYAIWIAAFVYGAAVVFVQPYRKFPALLHSYVTSLSDAVLITLWLWATGGFASPFFLLWYASIVGVAFRYNYRRTVEAAFIYGATYLSLLIALGQLGDHLAEAAIRVAYIFFVGAVGGEVSTEAFRQARSKVEMQDINAELERIVAERTAQLQAANQELEAFSYSVSHDLRAPLRSMDGFSKVLLEDYRSQLDEQGQDYLQRVRGASQRMGKLIEDILQLSRLSRVEMCTEHVDLSRIAAEILDDLHRREPQRDVVQVIADGVEVEGDARLLRVVLENLLGNAWKFTAKHPSARIEFGAVQRPDGPEYYVRDDGAGFDMAYGNKLFGAFQRLHNASEFDGTGIGLATVQRIVRRHGGRVWAEGQVEQGATFHFTLAVAKRSVGHLTDQPTGQHDQPVGVGS